MRVIPLVKKGPKPLVALLNAIIGTLNNMTVTSGGGGISVTTTATGWVITYTPPPDAPAAGPGPGDAPSGSGGGGSGTFPPPGWAVQSIDVMDASCNRSTIQVLVQTPS